MANKKKLIPCRVCGKLFEPCDYCQSNAGIFRWRNFACSYECAEKYIAETNEYREKLHDKGKTERDAIIKKAKKKTKTTKTETANSETTTKTVTETTEIKVEE